MIVFNELNSVSKIHKTLSRLVSVLAVRCAALAITWTLTLILFSGDVFAGGGPENLLLVVNADSDASKRIANEYVQLRNIPAANVLYLSDIPDKETIDVDEFRDKILKPIFEDLQNRNMLTFIDYVVYSADFPTSIKVKADTEKLENKLPKVITPVASINSLTYLAGLTLQANPNYLNLNINWYMPKTALQVLQRGAVSDEQVAMMKRLNESYQKKDFKAASETVGSLLKTNPLQSGFHYWDARCKAKLGKADEAITSIGKAIKLGWSFRDFMKTDEAFAELLERKDFQLSLASIPENSLQQAYSRGFRSHLFWSPNGMRGSNPQNGSRYFLSTVLAITRGAGTTVEQAIENLRRSAKADETKPKGKFYFTLTGDIRTKTRQGSFGSTIEELKRLGYEGIIVKGVLPKDCDDIVGAMIGSAKFDWAKSNSKILPGAICDNLTSHGGIMSQTGGQTKLSEFLRHGAAAASGTVTEPYAIQAKFPHPSIHVHYVRGCSLAEAFYQSISGPYQLLIVGDPLCQPWASRPKFELLGLKDAEKVKGEIEVAMIADKAKDKKPQPRFFDIYLDGVRHGIMAAKQVLNLDTRNLADGYHELRVIAIDSTPIETQFSQSLAIFVDNNDQHLKLHVANGNKKKLDESLQLRIESNIADVDFHITQGSRTVATIAKGQQTTTMDCQKLGAGTVRLQAHCVVEQKKILCEPVEIIIE